MVISHGFPWCSHENLRFPMVFPWFAIHCHAIFGCSRRDFGAFVDVGSERSGLVHISRMSDGFAACFLRSGMGRKP